MNRPIYVSVLRIMMSSHTLIGSRQLEVTAAILLDGNKVRKSITRLLVRELFNVFISLIGFLGKLIDINCQSPRQ